MKNAYLKLLFSLFILFSFSNAFEKKVKLSIFSGQKKEIIRTDNAQTMITVPVASRWNVKSITLHIEFIPSKALVAGRSVLTLFFNGVALYQQKLKSDVDIYTKDIKVPLALLSDYNKVRIKATEHYCMNCCEKGDVPELWTEILWQSSYVKINYTKKPIKNSLIYFRDYVVDDKQYNPVKLGILLQSKDDNFLTYGAKISGFLGSMIKYRKIYINSINDLKADEDIFLIGTNSYIKKVLNIKSDKVLPNIFVLPNPNNKKNAIIVLTAATDESLSNVINAFISLKKNTILGKDMNIKFFKKPDIKAYDSPRFIHFDKKITLSDLGYQDLKLYHPNYQYEVSFEIPTDTFLFSKSKATFHLAYNYGAGARKDSVINIFLNDKYIGSLPIKKKYGSMFETADFDIPVYLFSPGTNRIKIQYGLVPTGQGHCVEPNFYELQGTVFADKTYIRFPNLPHWVQMAYMQYFTTQAYPFSIYPDMKQTEFFIPFKENNIISSLYTLNAFIGEKTQVPPYSLRVVSKPEDILRNDNIIAIGVFFPKDFYNNLPITIDNNIISLKYSLFKKIKNLLEAKILNKKEESNLKIILNIKDSLSSQTIFTMGQSPYSKNKTVFVITSKNPKNIYKSIKNFYKPKFLGNIKGDLAIVDTLNKKVYYADIGEKYYVGHLPLLQYWLFRLGFSLSMLIIFSVLVLFVIIIMLKLLLDLRERRKVKS